MAQTVFPTKGNLMSAKRTLDLARVGFELLDRKRNILLREMMRLIDRAGALQATIGNSYANAYQALQRANVAHGFCDSVAASVPVENGLSVSTRSVIGIELPQLTLRETPPMPHYGFVSTSYLVDEAYMRFNEVKRLTVELAEVETCVYRLAGAVSKTQKRANALKNIIIPTYTATIRFITEALEEKEREDFSRMKVIKAQKHSTE